MSQSVLHVYWAHPPVAGAMIQIMFVADQELSSNRWDCQMYLDQRLAQQGWSCRPAVRRAKEGRQCIVQTVRLTHKGGQMSYGQHMIDIVIRQFNDDGHEVFLEGAYSFDLSEKKQIKLGDAAIVNIVDACIDFSIEAGDGSIIQIKGENEQLQKTVAATDKLCMTAVQHSSHWQDEIDVMLRNHELRLTGPDLHDNVLNRLHSLPQLQQLASLRHVTIPERLSSFSGLKQLILESPQITDQAMRQVGQLDGLRRLSLANSSVSDAGLSALSNLTQLRSINLKQTRVTRGGCDWLKSQLPNLNRVLLSDD